MHTKNSENTKHMRDNGRFEAEDKAALRSALRALGVCVECREEVHDGETCREAGERRAENDDSAADAASEIRHGQFHNFE